MCTCYRTNKYTWTWIQQFPLLFKAGKCRGWNDRVTHEVKKAFKDKCNVAAFQSCSLVGFESPRNFLQEVKLKLYIYTFLCTSTRTPDPTKIIRNLCNSVLLIETEEIFHLSTNSITLVDSDHTLIVSKQTAYWPTMRELTS